MTDRQTITSSTSFTLLKTSLFTRSSMTATVSFSPCLLSSMVGHTCLVPKHSYTFDIKFLSFFFFRGPFEDYSQDEERVRRMHGHRSDQGGTEERERLHRLLDDRSRLTSARFSPGQGGVGHDGHHVQPVLFATFHVGQSPDVESYSSTAVKT